MSQINNRQEVVLRRVLNSVHSDVRWNLIENITKLKLQRKEVSVETEKGG